ncbi:MAG TPA: ATP-grasp domain-containing protein [Methylobacterium sp.]|uniref:ATP-grasp domain-containing protein n=1 Tax=Methylorubrum sp. B1-46 TaxID=2897334 RepID=UPI001E64DFAC|nr:ATP-grasp domain-containing protein [Methylorubrum sp. B1-46]UGB27793.1 ATP-grasp domain-containing protein [Methylorubrum sp. B1-46]HEV2544703.1 ATP-grasp domain-containing protein [Methylobacterium sp.]
MLDLFGDEDTLALAEAHRPLPGRFGAGTRDRASVLAGLDALSEQAGGALGVVLGSGFEGAPDLIAAIAARHRLLGAGAETVAALKDPFGFAALCQRLAIPHPAVSAGPVADRGAWLLKRAGGCGGSHIRASAAGALPPSHYFQARMPGRAVALNFLSDGRRIEPLALTEQWQAPSPLRPFRYAGALACGRDEAEPVPARMAAEIAEAALRLARATGLTGLASADCLVHGESWWLLEINPRPGATLDVLDRRPTPLLIQHFEAALGRMPAIEAKPADATGAEICYAARTCAAVPSVDWPAHVYDRPRAGSLVARDAPLCTVTASGPDAAAVKQELRARAGQVRALLEETENSHEFQHERAEPQRPGRAAGREPRR